MADPESSLTCWLEVLVDSFLVCLPVVVGTNIRNERQERLITQEKCGRLCSGLELFNFFKPTDQLI
jgi:hypothetical protein